MEAFRRAAAEFVVTDLELEAEPSAVGGGRYYNFQPGRLATTGPQPRQIRLYQHDDALVLDLPSASEALVPQRSRFIRRTRNVP
jgi:hypothetical protein